MTSAAATLIGVSDPSQAEPLSPPPGGGNGWSMSKRPARLSVLVVEAIVDAIVSGRYPPGTLLPPEPVLCQSFDVSRSVVREAMKVLEEKGLARARQGHGTTISPRDEWNMLDPQVLAAAIRADDTLQTLDALVDVRVALESAMAATAARSMTDAELAELGELLEEMGSLLGDPERYLAADTRYHDFIMRCSGNGLGRSIIRTVHPHARASSRYSPPADDAALRLAHRGHTAIYERLRSRDPEGAATAMQEHIRGTWTRRKPKRG
jgi:DNA-binding FadR family transcriptional regulator